MASATSATTPFESYTPRVAIVTGGAQGIGRGLVNRLAEDGIDVAINDIAAKQEEVDRVVDEVRQKGRRAIGVTADVTVEAEVVAMIEKTVNELGSVDIMVANAGVYPFSPFLETPVEKFDKVLAVNARGVFLCFKHAALQMVKQGRGGRLIATSSLAGRQGQRNLVDYTASKFAVRGIVQTAAVELRKYGITANAFAPGPTITPEILAQYTASQQEGKEPDPDVPLTTGPFATPENHASVVSYLAKPESFFINGQTINVNGGIHFD